MQSLGQELSDFSQFGSRGEGWVLAQGTLILLVLFPPQGVQNIATSCGGILLLLGFSFMSVAGFNLGQSLTPLPKPRDDAVLVTSGLYQFCRHPIYGGLILSGLGLSMTTGDAARFALTVVMVWVLDQKAGAEEKMLEQKYGTAYTAYKGSGVKKLIPFLY